MLRLNNLLILTYGVRCVQDANSPSLLPYDLSAPLPCPCHWAGGKGARSFPGCCSFALKNQLGTEQMAVCITGARWPGALHPGMSQRLSTSSGSCGMLRYEGQTGCSLRHFQCSATHPGLLLLSESARVNSSL